MLIRGKIKYFDKGEAIYFFNKQFKNLIAEWQHKYKITMYYEKQSFFQILSWYWKELKYKTIINDKIKYFWPFIAKISNNLRNMCIRLQRIDNCIYVNKRILELNNNNVHLKDFKLRFVNSINSDLLQLSGEDLSLSILKLFDSQYKKTTLSSRSSFDTYLNDYKNKKCAICRTQPLMLVEAIDWINAIIEKMMKIVKLYKIATFNFVKHDIVDAKPEPVKYQEMFNIWYVVEKFIRPMLKLLFRYQEKNGHEYILERIIEIHDDLLSAYELILSCPDK